MRCDEAHVEDRESALVVPAHEQQIETISSGSGHYHTRFFCLITLYHFVVLFSMNIL